MSKIHYFQRYSQKENVVTNNTLLLLSRLYSRSPLYLEAFLNDLVEMEDVEIGVNFTQQDPGGGGSVTDGLIVQPSLKVVIETKLDTGARLDQLQKHLEAFDGEEIQVLLLLAPTAPEDDLQERLDQVVRDYNARHRVGVLHVCTTFGRIIGSYEGALPDHDYEMRELLEDYKDFCAAEGLLPREEYRMRAVPCGKTIEDNRDHRVYYQPVGRPYRPHKYLGIYKRKRVQYVGEIEAVVDADRAEDGSWTARDGSLLPPAQSERIENAATRAEEGHGWDVTTGHRFFLVESFHPTEFRKESPGGMLNHRYFDLGEVLEREPLPHVEEIAQRLSGKTW